MPEDLSVCCWCDSDSVGIVSRQKEGRRRKPLHLPPITSACLPHLPPHLSPLYLTLPHPSTLHMLPQAGTVIQTFMICFPENRHCLVQQMDRKKRGLSELS